MVICHIIFSFNTGGAETMLIDIINEQIKKEQINLIIINNRVNKNLLKQIDERINVYFINRKEKSQNPFKLIFLNLLLLKIKPDVIHCHNHKAVNTLRPFLRTKTLLTIHATGIPTNNFSKYAKLIAISKSVARDVKNRCGLEPTVIYNGIKIESIKKKKEFGNNDIFKLVQVSRLDSEIKGQHLAIEAIRLLRDQYNISNIQLDFIGEGYSRKYLEDLVKKYHLENQVSFLGLKDRKYINNHLKDYDLLIQPSLYEGFGLTVVEGMAAKIPVLVSNIDGPQEVIQKGKYGYNFKSGNERDCALKIKYIIACSQQSSKLNNKLEETYLYVKKKFCVVITANHYLNEYSEFINE